jgi:uncharacterized protein (TIGR02145 family)
VLPTTWYIDQDDDGLGDEGTSQSACDQPTDFVANSSDNCDDSTASNYNDAGNGACDYCGTVAGTVTFDGYPYTTVLIGSQCWFAENLRTTKYADETSVTDLGGTNTDDSGNGWAATWEGAMCVFNDDALSQLDTYGRLYNWYAVNDERGLCPSGWHVPTDGEFMTLEMELGMSEFDANETGWRGTDQATQMKSSPEASPPWNWNGTNTSGFSALAGGYRDYSGNFNFAVGKAFFWSASVYLAGFAPGSSAWSRELDQGDYVYRFPSSKKFGMSVRCVKDLN